jgi:hypothetical protein
MMSQKRVMRRVEWTIENVKRGGKIESTEFKLHSDVFEMKLYDNVSKWWVSKNIFILLSNLTKNFFFRKITLDVRNKNDQLFLCVWLNKMSVTRDDFFVSLEVQLGDCKVLDNVQSSVYKLEELRGWPEFLRLNALLYGSSGYIDKNSQMKLIVKVFFFFFL